MSYNSNYYYKSHGTTFQNPAMFTAPPPPSQYFVQTAQPNNWKRITDEEIIKQFECKIPNVQPTKAVNSISISNVHSQLRSLALALNEVKLKRKLLSENSNNLSDEEWSSHFKQIEEQKAIISNSLSNINNLNTDILRKLLAKRSSKRARQKRQRLEKRKQKNEMRKQREEKSRQIDEYLKKFQDDINKVRQEEESKLQADIVLKETMRKKQDAKKYMVKLDALIKLRKARMNTAKGRGENLSQKEAELFEMNIEKLKSMWSKRLTMYEKEESELQAKLQQASEEVASGSGAEAEVKESLDQWKEVLFGGKLPQVDFKNVDGFVAVRSQWDRYLHAEGSAVPVGWVPPTAKTSLEAPHKLCHHLSSETIGV